MESLSEKKLVKALKDNETYKGVKPFLNAIKQGNMEVSDTISAVIVESFSSQKAPLMTKLLALRLFKQIFMLGNMDFVDSLDPEIEQVIISAAAFNPKFRPKGKNDKESRGGNYFIQTEGRAKNNQTVQLGNSFVVFAAQIIKYFGKWLPNNPDNSSSRFLQAYEQLEGLGVPLNTKIYFTAQQEATFHKNYQQWLENKKQSVPKQAQPVEQKKENKKIQREQKERKQSTKETNKNLQKEDHKKQDKKQEEKGFLLEENKNEKQQIQQSAVKYKEQIQKIRKENEQKMGQTIKRCEQKVEKAEKCLKESENKIKKQQQQIKNKDEDVKQLRDKNMELEKKIKQMEQRQVVTANNQVNEAFEKYRKQSKEEVQKVQRLRKQGLQKIKNLQQTLTEAQNEKQKLKQLLHRQKQKNEQLSRQIQFAESHKQSKDKSQDCDMIKQLNKHIKIMKEQDYQKIDKIKKLQIDCEKWEHLYKQQKKQNKKLIQDHQNLKQVNANLAKQNLKYLNANVAQQSLKQLNPKVAQPAHQNQKPKSSNKLIQVSQNVDSFLLMPPKTTKSTNNFFSRTSSSNSLHHTYTYSNHPTRPNSISKTEKPKDKMNQTLTKTVSSFKRTEMSFLKKTTPKAFYHQKAPHSVFPFIKEYFPNIDLQKSQHFRACCISDTARQMPFYTEQSFQLFLVKTDRNQYCLKLKNKTAQMIKGHLVSEIVQIRLNNLSKSPHILPFSESIYRIEGQITNLNFRYPIISCILQQNKNQVQYRLPIPITLATFIKFDQSPTAIAKWETCSSQNDFKRYRCQKFILNKTCSELTNIMKNLNFQTYSLGIQATGIMRHPYIPQVKVLTRIVESQGNCEIETEFDRQSKISDAFSKVILQVLMFSLI